MVFVNQSPPSTRPCLSNKKTCHSQRQVISDGFCVLGCWRPFLLSMAEIQGINFCEFRRQNFQLYQSVLCWDPLVLPAATGSATLSRRGDLRRKTARQKLSHATEMSALPPKLDVDGQQLNVSKNAFVKLF